MATTQRLLSLDVFRGLTIAAMVLVNNPGTWSHVYPPLRHAKWHGATPTDWIFPFFLFIVGVAIALALGRRIRQGHDRGAIIRKILVRSALIFGIGLLLHLIPNFNFSTLRVPGVLQRIALVYLVCAMLFVYVRPRGLFWIGVSLLLGYWAVMTLVPVPGGHPPNLEPDTNLGAWLDRLLLEGHLWSQSKTWDPEGLLSTLPAIVTGISGILTGLWLKQKDTTGYHKAAGMFTIGLVLLGISYCWHLIFPINKQLWTSSFVCYTSGLALIILAAIYYVVDLRERKKGTHFFVVFGANALFIYIMSGLLAKFMYTVKWADDEETVTLGGYLYSQGLAPLFTDPRTASLVYALLNVFVLWLLGYILYRRRIFIKV